VSFSVTFRPNQISAEFNMAKFVARLGAVTLISFSSNLYAQTCFDYTGSMDSWVVPAGVITVTAEAWGAQGGNSTRSTLRLGGLGAYIKGDVTVTPGDNLKILVGGQGESLAVGGGGGGYSGGAGGPQINNCGASVRSGGGGGGSFNSGINQTNTASVQSGNGRICITPGAVVIVVPPAPPKSFQQCLPMVSS